VVKSHGPGLAGTDVIVPGGHVITSRASGNNATLILNIAYQYDDDANHVVFGMWLCGDKVT
jgi:hypothetical protein